MPAEQITNLMDDYTITPDLIALLPESFARAHQVIAIGTDDVQVKIAISDQYDVIVLDSIRKETNKKIIPVQYPITQINRAIELYYSDNSKLKNLIDNMMSDNSTDDEESATILMDAIIDESISIGATDIHFEPFEHHLRIRARVSGQMEAVASLPKQIHDRLISRIKILGGLDIAERRMPQAGRLTYNKGKDAYDVRISTMAAQYGESVVMRLLYKSDEMIELSGLGMLNDMTDTLKNLAASPHGIILVSGPTGSGKSTTLYSLLKTLDRQHVMSLIHIRFHQEDHVFKDKRFHVTPCGWGLRGITM